MSEVYCGLSAVPEKTNNDRLDFITRKLPEYYRQMSRKHIQDKLSFRSEQPLFDHSVATRPAKPASGKKGTDRESVLFDDARKKK